MVHSSTPFDRSRQSMGCASGDFDALRVARLFRKTVGRRTRIEEPIHRSTWIGSCMVPIKRSRAPPTSGTDVGPFRARRFRAREPRWRRRGSWQRASSLRVPHLPSARRVKRRTFLDERHRGALRSSSNSSPILQASYRTIFWLFSTTRTTKQVPIRCTVASTRARCFLLRGTAPSKPL